MSQENNSNVGPMLLTFLAGATLGALVVALTTPKTGPELRGDLKDLASRAKCKAGELAADAYEAYDDLKERTALAATDMKQRTVLAANDLKRGVSDAAKDLRG
jgi:gas vesicle protein